MTHFDYIEKIYYDLYLHNLKVALKYFKTEWVCIDDIKNNPSMVSGKSNSYLQEDDSELKMVEDILSNGMYWPMFVDENMVICEGCHRVSAMKKKYKNGLEWPKGKPILIICRDNNLSSAINRVNKNIFIESIKDVKEEDKDIFKSIIIEDEYIWVNPNKTNIRYLNSKINDKCEIFESPIGRFYKVKISDQCELFFSLIQMHILIREEMFAHQCLNNPIKPFIGINDPQIYNKWINGEDVNYKKTSNVIIKDNYSKSKYLLSDLFINDINILNLIDILYSEDKSVKIICTIDSNLINLINFKEINIFTINNKKFKIEHIYKYYCNHSLIYGFSQNLILKIGEEINEYNAK